MSDRVLRWYIDGVISRTKTEVGGVYRMETDYYPTEVYLHARVAGTGTPGVEVDILDDGVSIFNEKPTFNDGDDEKIWTTVDPNTIREGSIVRLDITGVADQSMARDLTVELSLSSD